MQFFSFQRSWSRHGAHTRARVFLERIFDSTVRRLQASYVSEHELCLTATRAFSANPLTKPPIVSSIWAEYERTHGMKRLLSTTPWRHAGSCRYFSTHSWPGQWRGLVVRFRVLPHNSRGKSPRYPLIRILCVPQSRNGHFEEGNSLLFARSWNAIFLLSSP